MGTWCTAQLPPDVSFKGNQGPGSGGDDIFTWNSLNTFHLPVHKLLLSHVSQHAFSDHQLLFLISETTLTEELSESV